MTLPAFDKDSKQPELKRCAVRVARALLLWRMATFALASFGSAIALLDSLAPLLGQFAFASTVLFGREEEGVLLRLADKQAPAPQVIEDIDRRVGLAQSDVLRYDDARRGVGRRIAIVCDWLRGVRPTGDSALLSAESWSKEWLVAGEPVAAIRHFLLAPSALAPLGFVAAGKVVCSCFNLTDAKITCAQTATTGRVAERIVAIQDSLRCGTNCGSCLPELRRLIQIGSSQAVPV